MKVTYKKGNKDKVHIMIDGEYKFTVDESYFVLLGLWQNKEIDEEQLEDLSQLVNVRRAYNQAVSFLSRRNHSERELRMKLSQKGYSVGVDEAIEKLKEHGYIDDLLFAKSYINELVRLKGFAKNRIVLELKRKGVSNDIIDEALCEFEFSESTITDIIRRKYMRYLSDEKGVKRTVNALLRMGYSYSEIKDALKSIAEQEEFFED